MRLPRRSTVWKARTDNFRKDRRLSKRFVKKQTDCANTEPASLRKQKSPSPEYSGEGEIVKSDFVHFSIILISFFIFPLFGSFLPEPLWDLWMRYTAVGTASYGDFSRQITLTQEGKILQEMHFKLTDQAQRPTFASDKARPMMAGNESGKAVMEYV